MYLDINIEKFESLLDTVKRDGIDELIDYIRKSDFYTAPASTRYHSCHSGGLLEHSLNVYRCLAAKKKSPLWSNAFANLGDDSVILIALLHDLCKMNFYGIEMKNVKVYSENGKKSDVNGRFDWESVPSYVVDDKFPAGHGEKSVFIASHFIRLRTEELMAIRWHMGFTEPKEQWNTLTTAINKYPIILAVHEADLEATYLLEKEM